MESIEVYKDKKHPKNVIYLKDGYKPLVVAAEFITLSLILSDNPQKADAHDNRHCKSQSIKEAWSHQTIYLLSTILIGLRNGLEAPRVLFQCTEIHKEQEIDDRNSQKSFHNPPDSIPKIGTSEVHDHTSGCGFKHYCQNVHCCDQTEPRLRVC